MAWRPLVVGDQAARVEQAVAVIAEHLSQQDHDGPAGLAEGAAGLAVFHGYLAGAGRGGEQRVEEHLERAIDAVAAQAMPPGLHEGFSGVAWAVQHLVDDADDLLDDIDAAVLELTGRAPWHERYDLISGLVGIGAYALERRPRDIAAAVLDNIVARLDENAVPAAIGRTLRTPPDAIHAGLRAIATADHQATGVAHGVAGAIALLGDVPGDRAAGLRRELTSWLAATSDPRPDGSQHPPFIDAGRPLGRRSAAWCTGDPGIAIALLRAALTTGDPALEQRALALSHAAACRPASQCGVNEPGLCHGAAGLMHIFNRIYQATGQSVFRDAAVRWLDETLALCDFPSGNRWQASSGLLNGAAGIALALLAVVGDREPRWDRFLLCDLRHR